MELITSLESIGSSEILGPNIGEWMGISTFPLKIIFVAFLLTPAMLC